PNSALSTLVYVVTRTASKVLKQFALRSLGVLVVGFFCFFLIFFCFTSRGLHLCFSLLILSSLSLPSSLSLFSFLSSLFSFLSSLFSLLSSLFPLLSSFFFLLSSLSSLLSLLRNCSIPYSSNSRGKYFGALGTKLIFFRKVKYKT